MFDFDKGEDDYFRWILGAQEKKKRKFWLKQ